MTDITHQNLPDSVHYHVPDQRIKRRTATVGLGALCVILAVATGFLGVKLNQEKTALADARARLDQATRDVTDTKASLTTSDTSLKDLRSQLDQAKQDQTGLQAQVKKEQDHGAALQKQLDQAQADLKSEQEKAQTQSTDLQAQLSKANENVAGLRKELDQAKSETADLKAQLTKAQSDAAKPQPVVVQARALPVTTDFRKSLLNGITLHIKNQGTEPLKLDVRITGAPKSPSKSLTIPAGATGKVDDLTSGATIVLASEGFEPVNLTAR